MIYGEQAQEHDAGAHHHPMLRLSDRSSSVSMYPLASTVQETNSGTRLRSHLAAPCRLVTPDPGMRGTDVAFSKEKAPSSGRLASRCVIIDFVPACNRGHVAQVHEELPKGHETNLTLCEWVMFLAYVMTSVAFYPALTWFFLS
jgi:hypothetical protein